MMCNFKIQNLTQNKAIRPQSHADHKAFSISREDRIKIKQLRWNSEAMISVISRSLIFSPCAGHMMISRSCQSLLEDVKSLPKSQKDHEVVLRSRGFLQLLQHELQRRGLAPIRRTACNEALTPSDGLRAQEVGASGIARGLEVAHNSRQEVACGAKAAGCFAEERGLQ